LARYYWGKEVKEFVSIQDYSLWQSNQTVLFQKTFKPIPQIDDRRQIWLSGGMSINENDRTDYNSIKYALGINQPINLQVLGRQNNMGPFIFQKRSDSDSSILKTPLRFYKYA